MAYEHLRAIKSIIVATDLEATSAAAFDHALALALVLKAHLAIIHVGRAIEPAGQWHEFPGIRATLSRWHLLDAAATRTEVVERFGITIRKVRTVGRDPAEAVVDYINRHPANLLVVGSDARHGLARMVAPSVAAAISRSTRLLTLFLPARARSFIDGQDGSVRLSRIVVPIAAQPHPDPALRLAAEIAQVFGDDTVSIDLVHAGSVLPATLSVPLDDEACRWRTQLLHGEPADAVAHAAANADLLVATTAGRHGPFDALLGSTVERLLTLTPCALLAVPATAP